MSRGAERRLAALAAAALVTVPVGAQRVLHRTSEFEITDRAVVQGAFRAVAVARDTIRSSYPRAAREVHFKFALNGADNEFPPGTEHVVNLRPVGGSVATPLYVFAREPEAAVPQPGVTQGEEGPAKVLIRLDLRHVVRALRKSVRYTAPRGGAITSLERATVIGDVAPLRWDIAAVAPGSAADLRDPDGDGIWETTLTFAPEYTRPLARSGEAEWARRADLARWPALESPEPLVDAAYRLSLEELGQLVRDDGALAAGAKWPGVWTRDVSFASLLSLALVAPDAVQRSLLAKVDSLGRIIQDTGTGGSWPISTDRVCWLLAAWELYQVTGDRAWLAQAYAIGRRSIEADRHAVVDRATGLMRGESSFLDWREQSYPRWMEPADIYVSQAIGTNAVHHGAYRVMARMAAALGGAEAREAARYTAYADSLRTAIDRHLWLADKGWYGQFRYGRVAMSVSPRAEALGLALAALTGVADAGRTRTMLAAMPQVPFGAPTFWPYIGGERFYHNASIWPFVTAFVTWAAADAGNTAVVEHGLATMLRGTALFLTNKENMVAETGHFEGTALNSDRQLWSVAGSLAMTYRVLFGLRLDGDSLRFAPMVPPAYDGERTLRGVRWRGATLDVTVRGHGAGVRRMLVDGAAVPGRAIPATLTGTHEVTLELDGTWLAASITTVAHVSAPREVPRIDGGLSGSFIVVWDSVPGDVRYVLHRDGVPVDTTRDTEILTGAAFVNRWEWQVATRDPRGVSSHLSKPVSGRVGRPVWPERRGTRWSGPHGLVPIRPPIRHRQGDPPLRIPVTVGATGRYHLTVRYANGNGPVNTEDKAAIRTLRIDGVPVDVVVLPQRGTGRWDDFGPSNTVSVTLTKGRHVLELAWTPLDRNMNGRINEALISDILVEQADPARLGRIR